MKNPFKEKMPSMGRCKGIAKCPNLSVSPFFSFANTPGVPALEDARGSVLLIGGDRGNGKTVYGHRLLHEYHAQGLTTVDLLHLAHVTTESPVRRHQVLCALREEIDRFGPEVSQTDDGAWGERLCAILEQAHGSLAVRLPSVEQKAGTGCEDIAREIIQYATAADLSGNVLIYEYLTDLWPSEWRRLVEEIEKNHDVTVRECELSELTGDDVWTYVQGVMARFPHSEITLAPEVPDSLRKALDVLAVRRQPSIQLKDMHGLMRTAFDGAIAQDCKEVSTFHVLSAAFSLRGAAA
ncbi:hypothetical protein [Actinomadura chokoriensis]|uniref:ATP-binding protein n=1 Tax=Actinomadura chokoriensis TaxID=454156 RepID=A0ABV4R074_9ACTN